MQNKIIIPTLYPRTNSSKFSFIVSFLNRISISIVPVITIFKHLLVFQNPIFGNYYLILYKLKQYTIQENEKKFRLLTRIQKRANFLIVNFKIISFLKHSRQHFQTRPWQSYLKYFQDLQLKYFHQFNHNQMNSTFTLPLAAEHS